MYIFKTKTMCRHAVKKSNLSTKIYSSAILNPSNAS